MISQIMTMNFLGATTGILISSCIFGLDFDLFNPDEPNPCEQTLFENLWKKLIMLAGFTFAVVAMVAMGIGYWKICFEPIRYYISRGIFQSYS